MTAVIASFVGAIPEYYDNCLGPAWFDDFAADLARRLPSHPPGDVLEIACGTGLVSRHLRKRLDPEVGLIATDLSQSMLDYATAKLRDLPGIEWRVADAVALPYDDRRFGAVVCGFGVMFVPEKEAALSEIFRVLDHQGILLFNVWDGVDENPHVAASAGVVEGLFPGDVEMRFRIPYEMNDTALLRRLVTQAGFVDVQIEKRRIELGSCSARTIATGAIRGTPRSLLIEKRGIPLDDVIEKVTAALTRIGGADPYRGPCQAIVVQARRPPD